MDVSDYKFSESEIIHLQQYRDNQADLCLKIRFMALLLLAKNLDLKDIASVVGKSARTIENWHQQYVTKGIDSLNSFQYVPKKTFLTEEQISQVIKWVADTNPGKLKEIKQYITDQFHVRYSNEAVRKLLKKNGLKILRPKVVPGNPPGEEEQKKNITEYFDMKAFCEPGTVFLFGDGMHLVHQNVSAQCWGDPKKPPVIKTNTGRKRLNILGAYNPDSYSFVHLTGEENCNAERVIEYYNVIIKAYPNAPKIILYLDNATYFKAKIVSQWLEKNPKLQIMFLPPYAPNLNLIERFWRFVKNHLVKNTYYEKYKTFRAKTFQLLNHVDKYVDELKTLMVEKFQIVKVTA
jgi:transposase